jgi:hypothetical protein
VLFRSNILKWSKKNNTCPICRGDFDIITLEQIFKQINISIREQYINEHSKYVENIESILIGGQQDFHFFIKYLIPQFDLYNIRFDINNIKIEPENLIVDDNKIERRFLISYRDCLKGVVGLVKDYFIRTSYGGGLLVYHSIKYFDLFKAHHTLFYKVIGDMRDLFYVDESDIESEDSDFEFDYNNDESDYSDDENLFAVAHSNVNGLLRD